MSQYTRVAIDGSSQDGRKEMRLKVLCDARVPLVGENTWVLDSCVSSCGYISDNGLRLLLLLSAIGVTGAVRVGLVVVLVAVVVVLLSTRHAGIIARVVGMVGDRV